MIKTNCTATKDTDQAVLQWFGLLCHLWIFWSPPFCNKIKVMKASLLAYVSSFKEDAGRQGDVCQLADITYNYIKKNPQKIQVLRQSKFGLVCLVCFVFFVVVFFAFLFLMLIYRHHPKHKTNNQLYQKEKDKKKRPWCTEILNLNSKLF